jgi:hypothetical protein
MTGRPIQGNIQFEGGSIGPTEALTLLVIAFPGYLTGQFEVAMTIIALRILCKGWNIGVEYWGGK